MSARKSIPLCVAALWALAASSSAMADLCAVGAKTEVRWKGDWYKATIVEVGADKCKITYAGYTKDDDEWVGPSRMRIKVKWKGDWYNARVLKESDDGYLVSYDGYGSEDNEVVPLSRIQMR